MTKRTRVTAALAAVLGAVTLSSLLAPAVAAAPATAPPAKAPAAAGATTGTGAWVLPPPTGPQPVGRAVRHLVDRDRPDPWVPTGPRELMVSVWYPASAARGARVAYATAEESRLVLALNEVTGVPEDALTQVRTHARDGAPPVRGPRRHPLVVLSPGFGLPRWTLTALAEDLASRGYVVIGVDHTYEAAAVTFPDGRVAPCVLCARDVDGPAIAAVRARDISFVLDRVLADRRLARLIDPRRIAVVGHSIGGAAAAATMLADRRVDAGVNLDGSFQPALARDLARPFLMVGTDTHGRPGQHPSWDETWPHLTGWRRWLHVPQMSHLSPSDAAVLGEWLGVPVQPLAGTRSVEIIRTYVAAFADRHLRHRHRPLLDGPSPRFPEVLFVGPDDRSG